MRNSKYEALYKERERIIIASIWTDSEKTSILGVGAEILESQLKRWRRSKSSTSDHRKQAHVALWNKKDS